MIFLSIGVKSPNIFVLAIPTNGNKVVASIGTVSKVSSTPRTMMITDG